MHQNALNTSCHHLRIVKVELLLSTATPEDLPHHIAGQVAQNQTFSCSGEDIAVPEYVNLCDFVAQF